MKSELAEAERAELIQSVKALFIPLFLFLSCVIFAAGVFLLYNGESAGWGFIAVTAIVATSTIVALIRFQNKYRVKGIIPSEASEES